MKTRKTFGWLMLAACLFAMSNVQVFAEEEVKISVPLITVKPVHGGEARDLSLVPFTAYYQGGTIYISTSAEFTSLSITITNESTGQAWNSATDISDGMGEISIANGGTGSYTVEILTEYGECFTGSFRLQ